MRQSGYIKRAVTRLEEFLHMTERLHEKVIPMKRKKKNRAWFERKVSELGEKIEQLPRDRQLKLFDKMEQEEKPPEGERERKGRRKKSL